MFITDGAKIIQTPIQAPNANCYSERWIRTAREDCLDWLLIFGARHLETVLAVYVRHYNQQRPHRSLELQAPDPWPTPVFGIGPPRIRRHDQLAGLLHEYERAA